MIPMDRDDRQLLIDTHRGHEQSARALWNLHAPRLLQYLRAILPCAADAEDIVQAVFCRIFQLPAAQIGQVLDPAAWLTKLARHAALNHLRAVRRRRSHLESGPPADRRGPGSPSAQTPSTASPDAELRAAIDSLPRRLREIVVLKHVGGLTFDQIAIALSVNRNTAAARHRAALDLLRRNLSSDAATQAGGTHHPRQSGAGGAGLNGVYTVASEAPHAR
jgi:RNA polymerase sigma factor (sigma-70 family)